MYREFFAKNKNNSTYPTINNPISLKLNNNYKDHMNEFNKNLMND